MEETLIEQVAIATGLPKEYVIKELKNHIIASGRSPHDMDLEGLREALVPLLQKLFTEVAAGENEYIKILD